MTGFFMKCNTKLKWVKLVLLFLRSFLLVEVSGDHSFSVFAKISDKLTSLNPW